jgi:ankyrin repeat protein
MDIIGILKSLQTKENKMKNLILTIICISFINGCSKTPKKTEKQKIKEYIKNENVDAFKVLLIKNPLLKDEKFGMEKYSLLQLAAKYNNKTDIIKQILALGVDINETDYVGNTALHLVCYSPRGKYKIIQLLLKNNAKINVKNKYDKTPLDVVYKSSETLEDFIEGLDAGLIENAQPLSSKVKQVMRNQTNEVIKLLRSHEAKKGDELDKTGVKTPTVE